MTSEKPLKPKVPTAPPGSPPMPPHPPKVGPVDPSAGGQPERRVDLVNELRGVQEAILLSTDALIDSTRATRDEMAEEARKTRFTQLPAFIITILLIILALGVILENRRTTTLIKDCLIEYSVACPTPVTTTPQTTITIPMPPLTVPIPAAPGPAPDTPVPSTNA